MVMVIMEGTPSPIKTFLKQYQLQAGNTLNGPSSTILLPHNMSTSSPSSSSSSSTTSSVPSSPGGLQKQSHQFQSGTTKIDMLAEVIKFPNAQILHKQLVSHPTAALKRPHETTMTTTATAVVVKSSPSHSPHHIKKEKLCVEDGVKDQEDFQQVRNGNSTSSSRSSSISSTTTAEEDMKKFVPPSKTTPPPTSEPCSATLFRSKSMVLETVTSPPLARIHKPVPLRTISDGASVWGPAEFLVPIVASAGLKRPLAVINHHGVKGRYTSGEPPSNNTAPLRRASGVPLSLIGGGIPMAPSPVLIAPDRPSTEMKETNLEGETVTCFEVGGERRLCFLQVLTTVLKGFCLPEINKECDDLQIICSPCSREQLEALRSHRKIPIFAQSCGLITKTDAERLVNALLHKNPPKPAVPFHRHPKSGQYFRVYHKCFGKAKGIVRMSLYTSPEALCIECVDCHGLFAPARFVAHSHGRTENKTCHWGFDSANWRKYLLLSREYEDPTIFQSNLDEFKGKFEDLKEDIEQGDQVPPNKRFRIREEDGVVAGSQRVVLTNDGPFEHNGVTVLEIEGAKSMLETRLGREGARPISSLLDRMADKMAHLEQICRDQDRLIRRLTSDSD